MGLVEINWNPDRRQLRWFAIIWLVAFSVAGCVVAWNTNAFGLAVGRPGSSPSVPVGLWVLGATVASVGLAIPQAIRPLYLIWMVAAFPIGWTVSHILLGLTYFGLFTLVSMVFRAVGYDPLSRRFDRSATTYWEKRSPRGDPKQYFKQF